MQAQEVLAVLLHPAMRGLEVPAVLVYLVLVVLEVLVLMCQ